MRILWLKTELLHPVDKGGKIRSYHMLKELKREHQITYLTLDDGTAAPDARESADEYCNELVCVPHCAAEKFTSAFYAELAANLVSSLPYALKKYENKQMRMEIESRMTGGNVDLVICDFLTPAVNMPESPACPTVLFQHNVESLIWKRHYQVQSNPFKKAYLFDQYRKMRAFESETCRRFNQVIAVSQTDAEIMRREFDITTVEDVPTGVDTGYFKPAGTISRRPNNLVFTGSMDWLPNEDAIRWFADAVLPLIRKSKPDVTVTVVGRNPSPALVELGKRDASVQVTGRVDDVRPYMDRAAAYIVPIRIGGGTRLKIYEAMAMEQPIISTTIGAEGLPLVDGKHLLLADTAESFAAAVTRVLTDSELARQLGASAASLVRDRFGWQGVTDRFVEISMMAFESFAADERLDEGRCKPEAVQNGVS
jgi:sugar transferase (PEP-CTERM/EpsH1 system associated)